MYTNNLLIFLRSKKTGCLIILFLLFFLNSFAQFTLRIEIINKTTAHLNENIYAAGNFNNWNPGDELFKNTTVNSSNFIKIKNLNAKTYQFKFTRGSWAKVETSAEGAHVENRSVDLISDTTITCIINGWKDDFENTIKHTLSSNVKIIDTAFYIPQLKKTRRVWIYLPENYTATKKHFPVIYLHDGQNLFDEFTSAFGTEWGVDEILDSLSKKGKPACIAVGIDNGGLSRMNEYNPYEFIWKDSISSKTFLPEGNEYINFIKQTLKPFIDKHYRTMPGREATIIAGSSMGGLISYYAAIKYPEVFGKAGVFSPAFWTAPEIKQLTDSVTGKINSKFFFYMGEQEGGTYITDMKQVTEKLGALSNAMIYSVIDTGGKHNEKAWRKWFTEFYNWVITDGYNYIIPVED